MQKPEPKYVKIEFETPEQLAKEDELIKKLKAEKEAKEKEIENLHREAANIKTVEIIKEMPKDTPKKKTHRRIQ